MKIALCVSSLPLCGIGTSVGIVRSGLSKAGHEVDVIITSGSPGGDYERARRDGWSLRSCGKGVRFLRERLRLTSECLSGYDVIINNHSVETQLIAPCLPGNTIRISVLRSLSASGTEQVALNTRHFDAAVAISQEMQRIMLGIRGMECPVYLIPNSTEAKSDKLPDLSLPLKIAYVGRIENVHKNIMLLPDIVLGLSARNVDFCLTIAGDGPDLGRLQSRMSRLPVASKVSTIGEVSRAEARALLGESHFALLPSNNYEGLSNVMLEAMALGSVLIVSGLENFKWVLGDVAAELQVPVNSADRYAERIATLATNPSGYRRVQAYLRERQRAMFTPETTVKGYLDLIARLKAAHDPRSFVPVPFDSLMLPKRYRRQCTVWWRCLQMAHDCLRVRAWIG
jgi:glycosyltransferase involved in cell wall biosynthesis